MIDVPLPPSLTSSRLPVEITDLIIDHISNIGALGNCSLVCTNWLPRSRHHLFKTVQLWSWRVPGFLDLVNTQGCTFLEQVERVEMDDAKEKPRAMRSRDPSPSRKPSIAKPENQLLSFTDIIALLCGTAPNISRSKIHTLSIHNVDWTGLSLQNRNQLRHALASSFFGDHIRFLEFHNATFHDTREVARILEVFPELEHLTADVKFAKYAEHLHLTSELGGSLQSLDVGTDDAIPVFLASAKVESLSLRNLKPEHFKYIHAFVKKQGVGLKNVYFELDTRDAQADKEPLSNDVLGALNFAKLSQLRTLSIEGLQLTSSKISTIIEKNLRRILSSIESSCLDVISLGLHLERNSSFESIEFDWSGVERVLLGLHFFGMRRVYCSINLEGDRTVTDVRTWVQESMPDLYARGVLQINVHSISSVESVEMDDFLSEGLQVCSITKAS